MRAALAGTEEHSSDRAGVSVADELQPSRGEPFQPASSLREDASSKARELAQALWVDGRVVLPEGTPADEKLFVVASGKRFADGSHRHRGAVASDGSFRVAFQAKTRSGCFELGARYLYLGKAVFWKSTEASEPAVLEPKLGARIAGRLVVPAGTDPGSVGGVVELHMRGQGHHSTRKRIGRREVTAALAFDFDSLVPSASVAHSYELRYDGEHFVGSCRGLVPEAGRTLTIDLLLRPGVTLAGVVRDSAGQPMAGVRLNAHSAEPSTSRWIGTTSAIDGTFRLGMLEAGKFELHAVAKGVELVRRDLGELEEGTTITGIELVLGVGKTIAGVVRWPEGWPAEAIVDLLPEGSDRISASCQSAPDGRFSIGGLTGETYRVSARAMRQHCGVGEKKHQSIAELRNVPAGSSDLQLVLVH